MSEDKFQTGVREVTFQEAGMKNFGPYIEPMILTFENNKLTLLTGPNGIGKTMSLDSIPFSLYGVTSKKAKGDDVVNNHVGNNCKTWVKFKINNDQYIVTRYHKYSKYGNTVLLNKNGTDIKKGQKEVLPEVERLICSQKAFMNTLMFGQKIKDFFTDLVDSDKKEIFRKIIGLEQYTAYYKEAENSLKKIKEYRNKISNQKEVNIGLLSDTAEQIKLLTNLKEKYYEKKKEDIENLNSSIENNKRLLNNWNNKLESVKDSSGQNTSEIDQQLWKIQSELTNLEKDSLLEVQKLTKQQIEKRGELKEECSKKKTDIINQMTTQIKELHDEDSKIKEELSKLTTTNQDTKYQIDLEIGSLKNSQKSYSERILEIKNNVLDKDLSTCPTCEQDVSEATKEKLIEKINNYDFETKKCQGIIGTLISKKQLISELFEKESKILYDKLTETNLKVKKVKEETENQKTEIDNKLELLLKRVDFLADEEKLKILNNLKNSKKELVEKEEILKNQREEREKIENEIKQINDTIASLKQNIQTLEKQLENKNQEEYDESQLLSYISKNKALKEAVKNVEKEIERIEREIVIYEFWKGAFSSTGIPSMLIDDSIPFMNKKIGEYLDLLTNGRYIVSFDTLAETKAGEFRDKISVHVIDTHTKANSRIQLSGGQTRIVDIATILTLGDLQSSIQNVKFNILLFDEIFDALDHDNANYVSKVLNKLKIGKSIYVISHQHQDQLEPDELLEFK